MESPQTWSVIRELMLDSQRALEWRVLHWDGVADTVAMQTEPITLGSFLFAQFPKSQPQIRKRTHVYQNSVTSVALGRIDHTGSVL